MSTKSLCLRLIFVSDIPQPADVIDQPAALDVLVDLQAEVLVLRAEAVRAREVERRMLDHPVAEGRLELVAVDDAITIDDLL